MPGLLLAGGISRYPKMISPISNALLADEESCVRTQMAKSMVGMARGMGAQFASVHLIPPFTLLLKDKDPNVRSFLSVINCLTHHISILPLFHSCGM